MCLQHRMLNSPEVHPLSPRRGMIPDMPYLLVLCSISITRLFRLFIRLPLWLIPCCPTIVLETPWDFSWSLGLISLIVASLTLFYNLLLRTKPLARLVTVFLPWNGRMPDFSKNIF